MAIAVENQRPLLHISAVDDIQSFAHIAPTATGPNLPLIESRTEEIERIFGKDNAHAFEDGIISATIYADASFGPIVTPRDDALWCHKYILQQGVDAGDIRFSPDKYNLFDAVLLETSGINLQQRSLHPGFHASHARYVVYAPLRRNLAILRNYLMGHYPPSGENATLHQATLKAMAVRLGEALRMEKSKRNFLQQLLFILRRMISGKGMIAGGSNRFLELANVPDRGIAFMYAYLRDLQSSAEFIAALPSSQLPRDWKLLPLEQTGFSSQNMLLYSYAAQMGQIINAFDEAVKNLRTVDEMGEPDRQESVEHARNILKNLRIITADMTGNKEFDVGDPRVREAKVMLQAALRFRRSLSALGRMDPSSLDDPLIRDAEESLSKINYCLKVEQEAMLRQEGRPQEAQTASQRTAKTTPAKHKVKEHVNQLLHKVEAGLNRASEIKQMHQAKTKHKTLVSQAMNQQSPVQQVLKEGMNIMSSPKIHQVSLNEPGFIQKVKEMNEPPAQEPQKTNSGGQGIGGK